MLGNTSSLSEEARAIIARVDESLSRGSFVSPDLAHLFTGVARQNAAATIKAVKAYTYYCPSHHGGRISSSGGGGGKGGGGGGEGGKGGGGGEGGKGGEGGEGGGGGATFNEFLSNSSKPTTSFGGGGSNAPMELVSKRVTSRGYGGPSSSSSSAVNTLFSKTSAGEGLFVHSKSDGGRGGSSAVIASGGGISESSASPFAIIGTNAKTAKRNVGEMSAFPQE